VQGFVGDQHGLNTLEHQPAKIAAIEAIWKTEKGVPLRRCLRGFPMRKQRTNDFAIGDSQRREPAAQARRRRRVEGHRRFRSGTAPVTPGVLRVPRSRSAC